jgi:transposase InsO family protein
MITPSQRQTVLDWVAEAVAAGARHAQACQVLGLTLRALQRWRKASAQDDCGWVDKRSTRLQQPANALTQAEREQVLTVANSAEYCDLPPTQIVPRLADKGTYLASESTCYRILRKAKQLNHRRPEREPKPRPKPLALSATGPDQLVSWDITYLPTLVRGAYLYLYVFMDIFSRKIVAWQVQDRECQNLASALFTDYVQHAGIPPDQLTLHSDNGAPMKGATLIATLEQLGVARSLSRPSVSNDNAYSEALFRVLKYRHDQPIVAFADVAQARRFVEALVHWYNHVHRHGAIGFVTPAQRHSGEDVELLARRHQVYQKAKAANPNRWSSQTRNWRREAVVHLNPTSESKTTQQSSTNKRAARKQTLVSTA